MPRARRFCASQISQPNFSGFRPLAGGNLSSYLHAPEQTTIEGRVKDGKVVELKVRPESRRKDIKILEPFVME